MDVIGYSVRTVLTMCAGKFYREQHRSIPILLPMRPSMGNGTVQPHIRRTAPAKAYIEQTISAHYAENRLWIRRRRSKMCWKVRDGTGTEFILANTIQRKNYDGRISQDNKAWAKQFLIRRTAALPPLCLSGEPESDPGRFDDLFSEPV